MDFRCSQKTIVKVYKKNLNHLLLLETVLLHMLKLLHQVLFRFRKLYKEYSYICQLASHHDIYV